MGKFNEEVQEKNEWKPSIAEVTDLKTQLAKFPQRRIYGQLVSPFYQYMISKNIMRLDESGEWFIKDPTAYAMYNKINSLREYIQFKDTESIIKNNPEEKEAFLKMLQNMRPANFKIKTMQ